jgi:hypothetical protein
VSTLNQAVGVDATTIACMYASQRTNAYSHSTACAGGASGVTLSPFGTLNSSNDCYLVTDNPDVKADYKDVYGNSATDWTTNGMHVADAFANNVENGISSLVTFGLYDRILFAPATPSALDAEDSAWNLGLSSNGAQYNQNGTYTFPCPKSGPCPSLSAPGVMSLEWASGETQTIAMPYYYAGHVISETQPAELFADVQTWMMWMQ